MTDILIHGVIGNNVRSKRIIDELALAKDPVIRINSKGGDVFEMIAIFNAIDSDPRDIPVIIDGVAFSAGAIIALAGKPIKMRENSLLMFHGVAIDGLSANKEKLKDALSLVEKVESSVSKIISTRTKKADWQIKEMLSKDTFFTAKEALMSGLIDEIIPISRNSFFNLAELNEISGLPESIMLFAKSFNRERKSSMALRDIATKLQLKFKEEDDDSLVEKLILDRFEAIQNSLNSDPDDDDDDNDDDDQNFNVPSGFMNMARNYRTSAIDSILSDGKITASVANELKTKYCADQQLKKSLLSDDSNSDEFENILSILRKNDKVINLKGRANVQSLPKDDATKGLLANRMTARFGNSK